MSKTFRHKLFCGDAIDAIQCVNRVDCIFMDPPDNIGLGYSAYEDDLDDEDYLSFLYQVIKSSVSRSPTTWISFNAKWTLRVGTMLVACRDRHYPDLKVKPCVQTYTFYQHNKNDLGSAHRPLWRITRPDAKIYPDQVRIESERQRMGDKRANPEGKVPGDVFDFPRVTGNSKQRRSWHPTQLHEGLVERCIALSTKKGDTVLDPFAGTGTVLRVCRSILRRSISIDLDRIYCKQIAQEHKMKELKENQVWAI